MVAGEDPVFSVARASRWLTLLALLVLGSAVTLGLVEFRPDSIAELGGLAVYIVAGSLVVTVIAISVVHLFTMLRLPLDLVADAVSLRRTRRSQREYSMSLAGSGPSAVHAPIPLKPWRGGSWASSSRWLPPWPSSTAGTRLGSSECRAATSPEDGERAPASSSAWSASSSSHSYWRRYR